MLVTLPAKGTMSVDFSKADNSPWIHFKLTAHLYKDFFFFPHHHISCAGFMTAHNSSVSIHPSFELQIVKADERQRERADVFLVSFLNTHMDKITLRPAITAPRTGCYSVHCACVLLLGFIDLLVSLTDYSATAHLFLYFMRKMSSG